MVCLCSIIYEPSDVEDWLVSRGVSKKSAKPWTAQSSQRGPKTLRTRSNLRPLHSLFDECLKSNSVRLRVLMVGFVFGRTPWVRSSAAGTLEKQLSANYVALASECQDEALETKLAAHSPSKLNLGKAAVPSSLQGDGWEDSPRFWGLGFGGVRRRLC